MQEEPDGTIIISRKEFDDLLNQREKIGYRKGQSDKVDEVNEFYGSR